MSDQPRGNADDWATSFPSFIIAWGIPPLAIVLAAWLDPGLRAVVWSIALAWMGSACLANAKRCGRVHCRYTGPYYLALIVPVALLGLDLLPAANHLWWVIGFAALLGGKVIWFVTESWWGRYRAE